MVQNLLQPVILRLDTAYRGVITRHRLHKNARQVNAARLPVPDRIAHIQVFGLTNHLVHRVEAERGHDLPYFVRDIEEVIHDVFGLPREFGAEHRILCRDSDRAGIQMTDAHHDTALRDQWRGREAKLLGSQKGRDRDIPPRFKLTISLDTDTAAKAVHHENLLRLRQPKFPRRSRVLDRRQRRVTCATLVAGDQDVVRMGFGDTRRDRANTHFRNQLDRDARAL